jgi:hypothetical protein
MVDPGGLAGGDHTIFVSGNDPAAKAEISRLLGEWFGWRDIVDLGDITTARGTESLLPVWSCIMAARGPRPSVCGQASPRSSRPLWATNRCGGNGSMSWAWGQSPSRAGV